VLAQLQLFECTDPAMFASVSNHGIAGTRAQLIREHLRVLFEWLALAQVNVRTVDIGMLLGNDPAWT